MKGRVDPAVEAKIRAEVVALAEDEADEARLELAAAESADRIAKSRERLAAVVDVAQGALAATGPQRSGKRGRRWADAVEEVYKRANEPWVDLRLDRQVIAVVRQGALVTVIGATGSGKSSLNLQMLTEHARDIGPAIYCTHELDADEAAARVIGQSCMAGWREALSGVVPREHVPDLARLDILERDAATIERLTDAVTAMRAEYPGQPILVGWDHLQATPGDDERTRVAKLTATLRRLAKVLKVVIIAVSQGSRASARALASGEIIGADAVGAGAESSQIERDSYVLLTLGDRKRLEDGTDSMALSIAKHRMGAGDVVFPVIYEGLTGRWRVTGEAQSATDVRAGRDEERVQRDVTAAGLAMLKHAEQSANPLTREELGSITGKGVKVWRAALGTLLAHCDLVEVDRRKPRARANMLWTRERAEAAGVSIVEGE